MFENPFVLPKQDYKRDINVLHHYVEDGALALQIETGAPYQTCLDFVKRKAKEKMIDPNVQFFERGDNGDRSKKQQPLTRYLGEIVEQRNLVAPTFTVYIPTERQESLLVAYIDSNVAARGVAKKAMFRAEMEKNEPVRQIKKIEQTGKKLANNAISGGHVTPGTPLFNKTAHSTLTSNCRVTAGYGNANNEKFLSGNRHYWNADIVRNNIISIVRNTDYDKLAAVIEKYGIRIPSVRETMACIEFSARLYFQTTSQYLDIHRIVSKLNDLQRAAFVYTGDLYWLMQYNENLVRDFLGRLSMRVGEEHPDSATIIKNAMEDHVHLACQICPQEMKGKEIVKIGGTREAAIVASTIVNIQNVLTEYGDMIKCLWVSDNMPASVAYFPFSIRRAALTGDTDSTIFTVQDWVIWKAGKLGFRDEDNALAATMIFLSAQTIVHVLAKMSANFGIENKRLFQIAMKNEFKFDVFTPTQVAKHYFALIGCQEGNLFDAYKNEIKGVHLKTSKAPKIVMEEAKKMMIYIMEQLIEHGEISIDYILKWVARIERDIIESMRVGSYEYFRIGQIKDAEGYKKSAEESPFMHYQLWQEVFAPKYGDTPEPPYMCVKVSSDINTKTDLKNWIDGMEDRALAARMQGWVDRTGRKNLTTFQLPEQCLQSKGIPSEIFDRIGVRKIVLDSSKVFYIILETLGHYWLDSKITKLVSDFH